MGLVHPSCLVLRKTCGWKRQSPKATFYLLSKHDLNLWVLTGPSGLVQVSTLYTTLA